MEKLYKNKNKIFKARNIMNFAKNISIMEILTYANIYFDISNNQMSCKNENYNKFKSIVIKEIKKDITYFCPNYKEDKRIIIDKGIKVRNLIENKLFFYFIKFASDERKKELYNFVEISRNFTIEEFTSKY